MLENDRILHVRDLLKEHVSSPSLAHIRDPHALLAIARRIVDSLHRGKRIWQKWEGDREVFVRSALGCWIPLEALKDYLNQLPGAPLTSTDIIQRMKNLAEQSYLSSPNEKLRAACLAIFEEEQAIGTELPATVGKIADFVHREERRLGLEEIERYKRDRLERQVAAENRLLSGADCKWTRLRTEPHWYSRVNGRTFRLSPAPDRSWDLFRVKTPSLNEKGELIGRYDSRKNAAKVIAEIAYRPEMDT